MHYESWPLCVPCGQNMKFKHKNKVHGLLNEVSKLKVIECQQKHVLNGKAMCSSTGQTPNV